jgi:hypothetical protein
MHRIQDRSDFRDKAGVGFVLFVLLSDKLVAATEDNATGTLILDILRAEIETE